MPKCNLKRLKNLDGKLKESRGTKMNVYEIWFLSVALVLLTGCEDRYRYPCQDPLNWQNAECKPPICTASGTCPEMLVKPEEKK